MAGTSSAAASGDADSRRVRANPPFIGESDSSGSFRRSVADTDSTDSSDNGCKVSEAKQQMRKQRNSLASSALLRRILKMMKASFFPDAALHTNIKAGRT